MNTDAKMNRLQKISHWYASDLLREHYHYLCSVDNVPVRVSLSISKRQDQNHQIKVVDRRNPFSVNARPEELTEVSDLETAIELFEQYVIIDRLTNPRPFETIT